MRRRRVLEMSTSRHEFSEATRVVGNVGERGAEGTPDSVRVRRRGLL